MRKAKENWKLRALEAEKAEKKMNEEKKKCESKIEELNSEVDELKAMITPKTKMLIFNSPSNPTGSVYTEEEVRAIAKVCEEAEIFVLSDEIYEKLCYNGVKPFSIAKCSDKMKDLTIVINGVSKTYAMTGWRVGYLACPKDIAKAIDSFQSHATSNACSISQYATIEALASTDEEIQAMVDVFDKRRAKLLDLIAGIDGVSSVEPDGAFYVMLVIGGMYGKSYNGKVRSGRCSHGIN